MELGYAEGMWTVRRLAAQACENGGAVQHPDLSVVAPGTASNVVAHQELRPHKIRFYLERCDPEFVDKLAKVLCFYREVALVRERAAAPDTSMLAYIFYRGKPGIQVFGMTAPDRSPVLGAHAAVGRDHEYVGDGIVTRMVGMDLVTGYVHRAVVDRHRRREFIGILRGLDEAYPKRATLRLILDNHSVHISRETRAYLASVPNRFEFVCISRHSSWLNRVEAFFSKVSRTVLRGIRVGSVDELRERFELHAEPFVFRWTYGFGDAIRV